MFVLGDRRSCIADVSGSGSAERGGNLAISSDITNAFDLTTSKHLSCRKSLTCESKRDDKINQVHAYKGIL